MRQTYDRETDTYIIEVNYSHCPMKFKGGLQRYLEGHCAPGSFLRAVLEGDLFVAMMRADAESLNTLTRLAQYLIEHIPAATYGSRERVEQWLKGSGEALYGQKVKIIEQENGG